MEILLFFSKFPSQILKCVKFVMETETFAQKSDISIKTLQKCAEMIF